ERDLEAGPHAVRLACDPGGLGGQACEGDAALEGEGPDPPAAAPDEEVDRHEQLDHGDEEGVREVDQVRPRLHAADDRDRAGHERLGAVADDLDRVSLPEALLDLQQLALRLRRDCPWDREQTERTIVPHTVEEAYEVADAALAGDAAKLVDEL